MTTPAYLLKQAAYLIFFMLLLGDIVYIVLHFTYLAELLENKHFLITKDRGYAEIYQYIKYIWLLALLKIVFWRVGGNYCLWVLLFFVVLMDDALGWHEAFGRWFGAQLRTESLLGLNMHHYGELVFFGAFGFLFLAVLWSALKCPSNNQYLLLKLFSLLVFFAVGVDILHSFLSKNTLLNIVFGLIEDSGEMIVTSALVAVVAHTFLKTGQDISQDNQSG